MPRPFFSNIFLIFLFVAGCAGMPAKNNNAIKPVETRQDVQSAVGSVMGTIKGEALRVKYCPVCGKHYSAKLEICPVDQTPLKEVEE